MNLYVCHVKKSMNYEEKELVFVFIDGIKTGRGVLIRVSM